MARLDNTEWDALVEDLFEMDAAHPYLSQTIEPPEPEPEPATPSKPLTNILLRKPK